MGRVGVLSSQLQKPRMARALGSRLGSRGLQTGHGRMGPLLSVSIRPGSASSLQYAQTISNPPCFRDFQKLIDLVREEIPPLVGFLIIGFKAAHPVAEGADMAGEQLQDMLVGVPCVPVDCGLGDLCRLFSNRGEVPTARVYEDGGIEGV